MRRKETTKQKEIIITYEDYILDEWLNKMIDELIVNHPNFIEEINRTDEQKGKKIWIRY